MRAQVFIISGSVYVLRYELVYLSKIINESSLGKETILYLLNLKRFPFNLIWKYKQKSFKYWLGCYKLTFMDIPIMCRYYMQKGYNISFAHNFVNVWLNFKYIHVSSNVNLLLWSWSYTHKTWLCPTFGLHVWINCVHVWLQASQITYCLGMLYIVGDHVCFILSTTCVWIADRGDLLAAWLHMSFVCAYELVYNRHIFGGWGWRSVLELASWTNGYSVCMSGGGEYRCDYVLSISD